MGLCDSVDYTIPGAKQALINVPNDTVTISKMAYGYSVELSPLQMLMFYNGIANNGKMITPLMVKEIRKNGKTIEEFESTVVKGSMCSDATLKGIRECLHDVVWNDTLGTASVNPWGTRKAQSDLVAIAGKTGTAQTGWKDGDRSILNGWFCGFVECENTIYVVVILKEDVKSGSYDCAPIFKTVSEEICK